LHLKEAVIALDTALLDPELPGFNHPKITIDQNRDMAKGIKGKKLGKIVHHLNQPGATQKGSCFSS